MATPKTSSNTSHICYQWLRNIAATGSPCMCEATMRHGNVARCFSPGLPMLCMCASIPFAAREQMHTSPNCFRPPTQTLHHLCVFPAWPRSSVYHLHMHVHVWNPEFRIHGYGSPASSMSSRDATLRLWRGNGQCHARRRRKPWTKVGSKASQTSHIAGVYPISIRMCSPRIGTGWSHRRRPKHTGGAPVAAAWQ